MVTRGTYISPICQKVLICISNSKKQQKSNEKANKKLSSLAASSLVYLRRYPRAYARRPFYAFMVQPCIITLLSIMGKEERKMKKRELLQEKTMFSRNLLRAFVQFVCSFHSLLLISCTRRVTLSAMVI